MKDLLASYPGLKAILDKDPTWLDHAVDANEASRITGISVDGLASYRSRSSGPRYLRPQVNGKEIRVVRYFRRDLYEWLLSGGRKSNTFDGE